MQMYLLSPGGFEGQWEIAGNCRGVLGLLEQRKKHTNYM